MTREIGETGKLRRLGGKGEEQVGRGVVTVPKGEVVRIGGGKGFCLFLFFGGKGKLEHRGRRKGQGLGRDRRVIVRGSHTRGERGELKTR